MLYYDVNENFKNFLPSLDFVETEALHEDIKADDWGLLPIEQYENEVELLKSFDIFHHIKGKFSDTTGVYKFLMETLFTQGKKYL